jgi:hypothetical protein
VLENNFAIGAEFKTNRDLHLKLTAAVSALNNVFKYKISTFTPPQNTYSIDGAEAVRKAKLNLCAYPPAARSPSEFISLLGYTNYLRDWGT